MISTSKFEINRSVFEYLNTNSYYTASTLALTQLYTSFYYLYPCLITMRLANPTDPVIISDTIFRGIRGGEGSILKIDIVGKGTDIQLLRSTFIDIETRYSGLIYFYGALNSTIMIDSCYFNKAISYKIGKN